MAMKSHFQRMAAYNEWANARLYDAVAALPDDRLSANVGAYFDSILGTLTHILVADRIWMFRMTGEGPTHTDLRDRPFAAFGELRDARHAMDRRITGLVGGLPDAGFSEDIHYQNTRGAPHHLPRQVIFTHFFNHQTHHRGQVHHMLSAEGMDPPPLDFLYFMLPAA